MRDGICCNNSHVSGHHQGCLYLQGSSTDPSATFSLVSAVDSLALCCLSETPPSCCPQSKSQDKQWHLSHFSASVLGLRFRADFGLWSLHIQAQVPKTLLREPPMLEGINIKQKDGRTPESTKINRIPCAQSYKEAMKSWKMSAFTLWQKYHPKGQNGQGTIKLSSHCVLIFILFGSVCFLSHSDFFFKFFLQ